MEWQLTLFPSLLLLLSFIVQGLSQTQPGAGTSVSNNNNDTGLLCYYCNSKNDYHCSDAGWDPTDVALVNCSDLLYMDKYGRELMLANNISAPNVCRKNYQKVTLGGKTDTRIFRTCGYLPHQKPPWEVEEDDEEEVSSTVAQDRCFTRSGTFEVQVTYCTCTKSKCNDGVSLLGLGPLVITFISAIVTGATTLILSSALPSIGGISRR